MARISTNSAAIARIAIQAPSRNFTASTMHSTTPVQLSPIALTIRERFMCRRACGSVSVRRCRVQCRSMPAWLTVNDTNTPTT